MRRTNAISGFGSSTGLMNGHLSKSEQDAEQAKET